MARRKPAAKRPILPDPLYKSEQLAKFINVMMRKGKKSVAEKVVYKALDAAIERLKKDKGATAAQSTKKPVKKGKMTANEEALEILNQALNNVRPMVEVKSRRVGGATYQVPVEVNMDRGLALAMRWVIGAAKARADKTMIAKLAAELVDAYKGVGAAMKIRDDMHRMAKANQAFAHYRW
jgi:small subunit ribosomal protein S7